MTRIAEARTSLPVGPPEQVRNAFCEWLLSADAARGVLPHVSCTCFDRVCEAVRHGDLDSELALTEETVAYVLEHRAEKVRSIRYADAAALVEAGDLPQFGVVVVDQPRPEVGLIGYTDDGYIREFVHSPTESGYRWADDQLATYTDGRTSNAPPTRATMD